MELHRPWDTPNIVVVVILVVAATTTPAAGSHHKLLLNPETLKLSTDTLIAAVLQCLVHVEILVNWVVDGVK
jgi:hypothetical protein